MISMVEQNFDFKSFQQTVKRALCGFYSTHFSKVTHLSTVNIAAVYLLDKSFVLSFFHISIQIVVLGTQTVVPLDNGYV